MNVEEISPILEQAQQEYRIWKKNAPYLYDYITTTSLVWPSLTVQFFPDIETPNPGLSYQRVVLGTFTLGQATDAILIVRLPIYTNLSSQLDNIDKLNYTDKHEFELNTVATLKAQTLQKINHLGDVNKVRYMPQNPDIIAALNNVGDLVVYDRTKHSNTNTRADVNQPQLRLQTDSSVDIFGIDWNKQNESQIVAADVDGALKIYDLKRQITSRNQDVVDPLLEAHNGSGINDIEWAPTHESIFAFVDENGALKVNDTRQKHGDSSLSSSLSKVETGLNSFVVKSYSIGTQKTPLNSLSFSSANYIATGDSEGGLAVFDLRKGPIATWKSFLGSITQVKWHHNHQNVLAASSADTNIRIFDLAKEEKEIFVHSGHMLGVNDFDWSFQDDWLVASVSDDNSLHTWKPTGMDRYKTK